MKEVFSTSDVAELCHVTTKTVANWIDADKLKCMKTGGGFRKVFREDLIPFMKARNIPYYENATHTCRILIIDDNPDDAQMLKTVLEAGDLECEIEIVLDGEEGIFKIGARKPDLVVLDIRMPKMDGFNVYDMVKKAPETSGTSILFMTGFEDEYVSADLKKRGIERVLKKPLVKDDVLNLIKLVLKKG